MYQYYNFNFSIFFALAAQTKPFNGDVLPGVSVVVFFLILT